MGKMKKASPIETCLSEAEFFLIIDEVTWKSISVKQKMALIDHELCHLEEITKEDGPKWVLRTHSVEEFTEILERHGAWKEDLQEFVEKAKQIELPL